MKKYLLSLLVILSSASYALYRYSTNATSISPQVAQQDNVQTTTPEPIPTPAPTPSPTPTPKPNPIPIPIPTPTPTPAPKPKGQYADGTYTGNQADAYYGIVEVRATIQNSKITNIEFLQYPNDRSTSREISNRAMPVLKSEAISAQSANVDVVSGATQTSEGFQESLGNALAQAKI